MPLGRIPHSPRSGMEKLCFGAIRALGGDSRRALCPAVTMVPTATSHKSAPTDTQSVAFPHSTSKITRPGTETIPPPNDLCRFQKPLQKPQSHIFASCHVSVRPSLVYKQSHGRQRKRHRAGWQPLESDLKMRQADLTAAKTTPLQGFAEEHVSATSCAGVVDPILA